jgi:hypothetical protein
VVVIVKSNGETCSGDAHEKKHAELAPYENHLAPCLPGHNRQTGGDFN